MPTPFTRRLTGLVGALVLGSVSAPVALAQDAPRAPSTMVVLDSSGSMINNDAGGQTRIDAAKDAARAFIDEVGDSADLGLVTYGGNTGETDAEREAGCRDITLVTAPGDDTADDMLDHIDSLEPRGFTPIGDSLIEAADALPSQGGTIVLVSDGIDTCAPPPVCEVAADLADRGVDIVINTVGFNVDAAARAELQCIADAAGGTYADATDADTLAEELKKATTRTYRAYRSDVERLDGAATFEDATPVPRDTMRFLTSLHPLPADANPYTHNTPTYFRLPVRDGEHYVVSAQSVQAPSVNTSVWDNLVIDGEFVLPGDPDSRSRCTSDAHQSSFGGVNGIITGTVHSEIIGEGCDADEVVLTLNRRGDWRKTEPVDVEVTVTRIDPFTLPDGRDAAPADDASPDIPVVTASTDTPETVTPGVWFDDAAELTPGETVAVDIVPGETQFFRVPAEYGQHTAGHLRLVDDAQDWDVYAHDREMIVTSYNEARAELPLTENRLVPEPEATLDFAHTDPVRFQNRFGEGIPGFDARHLWQDGDQIVAVRYRDTSQGEIDAASQLPPLTYHLTLDVEGKPQAGPTFRPADAPSTETATSNAPTTGAEPDTAASEDTGTGMGLWLGVGAVALVIVGAAGFLLGRRK